MADSSLTIRKALVSDVPEMAEIINAYAKQGLMLQRPLSRMYDNIRDYSVLMSNDTVVGCAALHIMWSDLAEIRALAISETFQEKGYGRLLVEHLLKEARAMGIPKVFSLTYKVDFFKRLGFNEIDKKELPHKIWNECVNCVHFPNCNEVAMMISFNSVAGHESPLNDMAGPQESGE